MHAAQPSDDRDAGLRSARPSRRPWVLYLVVAVCAAPMLLSYFSYYVARPEGRTNYGTILDPRAHPMPALPAVGPDGKPASLAALGGKWVLLMASGGACTPDCARHLWQMRQLRLAQGKNMDRVERVWLVTDDAPLPADLGRDYAGTRALRVAAGEGRAQVRSWLPPAEGATQADHLYLVDPLGNLMMRFPKGADPSRVRKDLARLLAASGIG